MTRSSGTLSALKNFAQHTTTEMEDPAEMEGSLERRVECLEPVSNQRKGQSTLSKTMLRWWEVQMMEDQCGNVTIARLSVVNQTCKSTTGGEGVQC